MNQIWKKWALSPVFKILALVLLILITYAGAVNNGFVWDDNVYLTDRELAGFDGLKKIWFKPTSTDHPYYPITHSVFWIFNKIFKDNPVPYHAVNIIFHVLNALMVWLILKRLKLSWAWIAAALFALHPVHVESVAWVAQVKNTLSALLYLVSMYLFIRFYFPEDENAQKKKLYYFSVGVFVLSMLSKTAFCVLPIGLLLIVLWKNGKLLLKDLIYTAPYFFVAILVGLFTIWMEYNHVGSHGSYFDFSVVERTLIAGRAVWFYAYKLFIPYKLNFVYPQWVIDASIWWQYLFPLSLAALILWSWLKRERVGLAFFCCLLFFVSHLFPVMGFMNIYMLRYTFVTDHWQYVASLGLIVLFAGGTEAFLLNKVNRNSKVLIWGLVLVLLMAGTFRQSKIYKNRFTLFDDIVKKDPKAGLDMLTVELNT